MKNKFNLVIAMVAIAIVVGMGCGSSSPLTSSDYIKQMLTMKAWNLISYGIDENMNAVLDGEEPRIKDCEKDDVYNFYSDNSGSISDNNNVCTPAPAPSFTWQLPGNDPNKIEFLGQTYSIATLDSNNLVLKKDATTSGGQSTQYIAVYHRD